MTLITSSKQPGPKISLQQKNPVSNNIVTKASFQVLNSENNGGDLAFYTNPNNLNDNLLSEKLRIKDNGFVGIGTSNPSTTLDVAGNIGGKKLIVGNVAPDGFDNIEIGKFVGNDSTIRGGRNIFVGTGTGNSSTSSNASFNTMIGYNAGTNATGAGNVFVGFGSGFGDSVNKNIVIR
jgi:hypothetical protein